MGEHPEAENGAEERLVVRRFHWIRHLLVFLLLTVLCFFMYWNAVDADFQFDDEPNITKVHLVQIDELTQESLSAVIWHHPAKNRPVVNLSFALQHWFAQYVPRITWDGGSPTFDWDVGPRLDPAHFRIFNYTVHILAGFAVYLLMLRLLQLPRVRERFGARLWPMAVLITLVWFCCPIQIQAVTYIVQRATSMAAMFYIFSLVAYIEARDARGAAQYALYALALVLAGFALASKEYSATLPIAILFLEYFLIDSRPRVVLRRAGALAAVFALLAFVFMVWYFGRTSEKKLSPVKTVESLWGQTFGRILADRPLSHKVKISSRQRVMTEARIVAMYQSLMVFPMPWRLNLDYDFLETTHLFHPDEFLSPAQVAPLLQVLLAIGLIVLAPPRRRAAVAVGLIVLLTLIDQLAYAAGSVDAWYQIGAVWTRPWPIPGLVWHAALLAFAAFYSLRRPLLTFGIVFFYLGHVIESTVLNLELVYEHRLYLPSVGFYLMLVLLVDEVFHPPAEETLGPRPFPAR